MAVLNLKIEQFEGPLDLLLALIARHKLDIFDIPIALVAEQYTAYLEEMRSLNLEVTSDFIAMAAELMLIKSRMLLPKNEDAEDPRRPLVDALLEHQRAQQTALFLRAQAEQFYDRYTKPADEPPEGAYERAHAVSLLTEAFSRIALRAPAHPQTEEVRLFKKLEDERYYTVEEKVYALLSAFERHAELPFLTLFTRARGRSEMVAIFLAVLECVRKEQLHVFRQEDGEILLRPAAPASEGAFAEERAACL